MNKLYKSDFIAIADCIRSARTYASDVSNPVVINHIAKQLAKYLARTNAFRFDEAKFIEYASGVIDHDHRGEK